MLVDAIDANMHTGEQAILYLDDDFLLGVSIRILRTYASFSRSRTVRIKRIPRKSYVEQTATFCSEITIETCHRQVKKISWKLLQENLEWLVRSRWCNECYLLLTVLACV